MAKFISLGDLQTSMQSSSIRVKVISRWSTKRGRNHYSVMLLGDEKGLTIEGSLNYAVSLPYEIALKEDDWVEICNFKITHAADLIRTTRNKYKLSFTEETLFSKIEPIMDSDFLSCVNFLDVLRGLCHPNYCIDLCGSLVGVGDLQVHEIYEPGAFYTSIRYSMEFTLINLEHFHIKCVAHGSLAHNLNAFWRANSRARKVVVCVLRLWRIEWGEGCLNYVTNLEGGSQILFGTDIPEIGYFNSKIRVSKF